MKKRCKKRDFTGIHDRFLRDHVFRGRMIENSRDDEVCRAWDVLADEDHTYHMSQEEFFHYRNNWRLHLNKPFNDTQQLTNRSDFKQALSTLKRLQQEAGGDEQEPIPYWKYKQWKPASSSSSQDISESEIEFMEVIEAIQCVISTTSWKHHHSD